MNLLVGTSGYSYKEWKGNFYPEKLPAKDMLAYYATRLPAVEINNTFYRLPQKTVLENWKDQVPENFRFSVKASQRITHFKRLNGVADETKYLLETAAALGERLGPVLFQLPPNMKKDLPRLEAFLQNLPADTKATWEFRHPTWLEDDVLELLSRHNQPLCISDTDDMPVNHVDKWKTPMLVVHGEKDFRIPYSQGLASFTALQRREIPSGSGGTILLASTPTGSRHERSSRDDKGEPGGRTPADGPACGRPAARRSR